MPNGMDVIPPEGTPEQQAGAPLDGVRSPEQAESPTPQKEEKSPVDRKKLLLMILGGAGASLFLYLVFAVYLMAKLPSSDGSGQGLRLIGNLFFGTIIVLGIALLVLIALRSLRSGMDPNQLPQILLRPGILVMILAGIGGMVMLVINQSTPLPIDILEPANTQNLTAPVSITFGTDRVRSILRKQGLRPQKYKWDFDGDGSVSSTGPLNPKPLIRGN